MPATVKLILKPGVEDKDGLDQMTCAHDRSPDKSPSPFSYGTPSPGQKIVQNSCIKIGLQEILQFSDQMIYKIETIQSLNRAIKSPGHQVDCFAFVFKQFVARPPQQECT